MNDHKPVAIKIGEGDAAPRLRIQLPVATAHFELVHSLSICENRHVRKIVEIRHPESGRTPES